MQNYFIHNVNIVNSLGLQLPIIFTIDKSVLFCPANSAKPKNVSFTIKKEK